MTVADLEYLMDIRARIRSVRESDEDTDLGLVYGLQFVDVSAEDNLVLASFVFQQLAENRLS
jgi:c-di-GMP-binding flagellar brake protein YcgR